MASLPPTASNEEIEEELVFLDVLISSLDYGADDYAEKLATFQGQKEELEGRLKSSPAGSRPPTARNQNHMDHMPMMDGSYDSGGSYWQTSLHGRPGSNGGQAESFLGGGPFDMDFTSNYDMGTGMNNSMNNGMSNGMSTGTSNGMSNGMNTNMGVNSNFGMNLNTQPSSMKRSLPYSWPDSLHPSKRLTPVPSNAATPSSSVDSHDSLENFNAQPSERLQRHMAVEADFRRRREAQAADELLARSFTQRNKLYPSPSSSSRPRIQTTLDHNGSFQRPPPPPQLEPQSHLHQQPSQSYNNAVQYPILPLPNIDFSKSTRGHPPIKPESGIPKQQQHLVQRSRIPETIDLTNSSDDDEEDVSEIAPIKYTPNGRSQANDLSRSDGSLAPLRSIPPMRLQLPSQMPGAYPTQDTNVYPTPYNNSMYALERNRTGQSYPSMQQQQRSNSWMDGLSRKVNEVRQTAHGIGSELLGLAGLMNESSPGSSHFDDDDDSGEVIFGGSRQLINGAAPYAGYSDMDLYQRRRDDILNYDPTKTTEEINALLENIRPDEEMPAHLRVQTPDAMAVKLHKYQELGLTWLHNCEDGSNSGGILADDMGLGKTIQMIALIVTRKSQDPRCKTTLIVAPVALMRQWKGELEQKVRRGHHQLTVFVHHGAAKKKSFRDLAHYDVVLTTFGSLAAELKRMERYQMRKHTAQDPAIRPNSSEQCCLIAEDSQWYRVILDEAQCIKNVNTQTAKAACFLRAKFRFCMTGTPMMNGIQELYSLVKFLRIKPYSEWTRFRMDFVTPMKSGRDFQRKNAMTRLQGLCKAMMLRRTKKSMFEGKPILVLPERTNEVANPEFSDDEKAFYRALEDRTQLQFNKYLRAGTVGSSYSAILVLLLRLRQACCHPHLIKDFGVSAAADVSPETLLDLAKTLDPQVIERIKATGGNFECPVCYDAVTNPAIFIPCGHDACSDCFARIADPANAIRDGDETQKAKCPNCRAAVDPKRITDFDSFKKVHMPELMTQEEQKELSDMFLDFEGANGDSETDSETDSDDGEDEDESDEVDSKGDLRNFIVNDDVEDSETESEAEEVKAEDDGEGIAGPSTKLSKGKGKGKAKEPKKSKKSKGKKKAKEEKKKSKKAMTLAELKKLSTRNRKAHKAYMKRLRADWMSSAKIEKTMETLKPILEDPGEEKVLIFSQWTSLLDLLEVPIDREGWGYRRYDGSMNAKMRGDAVDDFRDPKKNVRIMLVSLKAGNAGLNLNAANNVIILDPFWNPYIEEQAIDRAHRLGQTRPVKVQRILVPNTVEDRIIELQEKKRAIISEALDEKAGQNIARLGVQELAYLFGVTRNASDRVPYAPRER